MKLCKKDTHDTSAHSTNARSCRELAVPYELVQASGAFLIIATSQAGLGGAWNVFRIIVMVGGTCNTQFFNAFKGIIRSGVSPVTNIDSDGIRLCKRDGKSCAQDLKDKHWIDDLISKFTLLIYPGHEST